MKLGIMWSLGFMLWGALSSCGHLGVDSKADSKKTENNVKQENYKYDIDDNGCKTGEQKFTSKKELCEGLRDHARNNYCALRLRKNYFEQSSCSGSFLSEN
jgi:hypothetical protein